MSYIGFSKRRRDRVLSRSQRPWSKERGAAAVEFAVVAPVLFAMLLGMMEFGRILTARHILTTAARVAAREAILPGTTAADVTAAATSVTTAAALPMGTVTVACSPAPNATSAGSNLTVTVSAPMSAVSKLGSMWFGSSYKVSAVALMRKEGVR